MILNKNAITLAEVKEHVKDMDNQVMSDYIKAFVKLSKSDAEKCMSEIRALNNPKVKDENLVKIVDILPKDAEDLGKIFMDVMLSEEESNAILAIVKKYS